MNLSRLDCLYVVYGSKTYRDHFCQQYQLTGVVLKLTCFMWGRNWSFIHNAG